MGRWKGGGGRAGFGKGKRRWGVEVGGLRWGVEVGVEVGG